jgi:hypothetical protein
LSPMCLSVTPYCRAAAAARRPAIASAGLT